MKISIQNTEIFMMAKKSAQKEEIGQEPIQTVLCKYKYGIQDKKYHKVNDKMRILQII
jgi:hypothetical protein